MAVASKNRHNAAFVVGSVLGAVAGAAVALWKTPYTGEELRSKLTGAGSGDEQATSTYVAAGSTGTPVAEERSVKDKVLSTVEKTLAPIVGVELGKTANGSGADTTANVVPSGEMKVKEGYGTTLLRHPHAWKGEESDEPQITREDVLSGEERLTGTKSRIDPEKWAAAYGDGAEVSDAQPTRVETPVVRAEPETITTTAPAEETTTITREEVLSGEERLTGTRSRINADTWAAAYGTKPDEGSQYESKEAESEAQTGLGAAPAYPGSDQTGHQPVEREAPDDSIADVAVNADDRARESDFSVEDAATVDDLTKPQTDRVPDSMQQHDAGSYHPFPKLGGKEK